MNIEVAKVLAIAGSIASCLVVAIIWLIKWLRSMIEKQQALDAARIEKLETDLEEANGARLKDAKDYANGVIALSHRFREAVMAVTKWPRK
jgi:hypothetical protein